MAQANISFPAQVGKTAASAIKNTSNGKARLQSSFADVIAQEQQKQVKANTTAKTAGTQGVSQRGPVSMGLPLRSGTVLAGRTPTDMMRMQSFNNGRTGLNLDQSTAVNGQQGSDGSNGLRTIAAAGNGKGFALSSSDFIHTSRRIAKRERVRTSRAQSSDSAALGKLSAKFESGSDGIAAIGYDSTGGTSYGKYQIASKVGSMKSFLAFLDGEAPDLSKRLRNAGPANTGSRRGRMPDEWRAIAKEQPERFEQLQEAYIHESHYKPALNAITRSTGIDASDLSAAMREVIWSTAVQHGPAGAARIFARADSMSGNAEDKNYERKMINNVYTVRSGQFGSSTTQVRNAVKNRFREERQLALNMLDGKGSAAV